MRKDLPLIASALVFIFASCNMNKSSTSDDAGISTKAKKNLATDAAISKVFENGDVNSLDSLVATDLIDHRDNGDVVGLDSMKAMIKMMHASEKDMKTETIRSVADDDYVFSWMHYKGTSSGAMMPPGPYDMRSIELVKYKDGKAAEHWSFMQAKDVMEMMSKMPNGSGDKMMKDTTKTQ